MVARLATRIAKLDKAMPRPEPGCVRCRGQVVIHDCQISRPNIDGVRRAACSFCGTLFTRTIKVLVGVDPEAL